MEELKIETEEQIQEKDEAPSPEVQQTERSIRQENIVNRKSAIKKRRFQHN